MDLELALVHKHLVEDNDGVAVDIDSVDID